VIVGVTGHRDVEQEPGELLAFARLSVALMVERGCTEIITGMARGWDLKVARAAADLGVPFIAAVPFIGQTEYWVPADRADHDWALARASRVHIQSKVALNVAYILRDEWIVNQCDELWALDSGRRSGSHTTVLYAEKVERTVRSLWEPWLRFRAERT
jgi:hypothetical protein